MPSENDLGRTTPQGTKGSQAGSRPRAYHGQSADGVTCVMCGRDFSDRFPGKSGSIFGCPGCQPSGGGVTKKYSASIRDSLNSNR